MKTEVKDLATGKILIFSIPPVHAVIAAHEQAKGNGNTWDYIFQDSKVEIGTSGKTVFCGQFGALL